MSQHDRVTRLFAAFPSEPLHDHVPIVAYPSNDEGVADFFRGRSWATLSSAELRAMDFAPTAFSDAAFMYFLPAYIRAYYEEPATLDSLSEKAVIRLGQIRRIAARPSIAAREPGSTFNDEQLEVIRDFLRHFAESEGPCAAEIWTDALAGYVCDDASLKKHNAMG